ncbi:DUF1993 domain-containing protein [Novosphingobium sp. RD2P27]|uniref:DUF1993 domain-containing protein n=1 Tax=Novosphingobium kalidii TaxID=3230299 RepID=A0ABV2D585_9SPHN
MSFTTLLIPTHTHMLKALSGWLEKAEVQRGEAGAGAILSARLAPDMFPLATQVRFACVQAYEAAHRLRGLAFPALIGELLDEGRNAADQPGSLASARARIAETVAFLETLEPGALDVSADSPIAHELANGMIFDLTAEQYVRDWALGQFYFHIMAAYAILRSEFIEVGKADYIPHLLPHLRSGTGPRG